MNHLVAIVGPTAIGKSRLAIQIAQQMNAEIVSADSRQVYRFMDIGTAKPSPEELAAVPHHLINIINPDEDFSLARYQQLASQAIQDIQARGALPILVGGSGQYVWSLIEGWGVPRVAPDQEYRRYLEKRAASDSGDDLYQELQQVDPVAAARIDPQNTRRIIRALEVYHRTGTPFSELRQKQPPPFTTHIIGLTTERNELYRRIDRRADAMIEQGLVEEVVNLLDMGYNFSLPALASIGYKQIGTFIREEVTLETAIQQIKFDSHRLVRNQYSWFRRNDPRIRWLDITEASEDTGIVRNLTRLALPEISSP